jgi:predicted Na+-dependent transporter
MRSVIAFYRKRPMVAVVVFAIGLAICVATAMFKDDGGIILPVALVVLAGFIVGAVLAIGQRREQARHHDELAALDPTDPRETGY